MYDEIDVQRSKLGGVNAARQNNDAIDKQVRVLENRLDKALVKFNKALAVNKRLRAIIDNLRRERLVFDNIYHKFERELIEQKKQMADIIEMSNAAYEARDEAQTKIIVLREKAEKEYQSYIQEIKELDRTLEQDRRLKEFMATKISDRSERADGIRDGEKKGDKDALGGTKFPSQESLRVSLDTYENAFSEIRKVTGISDIGELVQRFKAVEDQNFSLFNYVNEINNEIEMHAEEMVEIQRKIDAMKIEAVTAEEERKKVMRKLEEAHSQSCEKAMGYERQYNDTMAIMSELRIGIEGLIAAFQAAAKQRPPSSSMGADGALGDMAASIKDIAGGEPGSGPDSAPAAHDGSHGNVASDDGEAASQPSDGAGDGGAAGTTDEGRSSSDDVSSQAHDVTKEDGDAASGQHQQPSSSTQQQAGSDRQAPQSASHATQAKRPERVRAHLEFNLPSESIGSHGVTESNLLQFLGLIEQKSNELLTLNYIINAPKKAVPQIAGMEGQEGAISLIGAGGVAGLLGQGPGAPIGTLTIVAPSTGDDHDSADNLSEEEDRPLTRDELKLKTLRGLNKREKTATPGHKAQAAKTKRKAASNAK
ncbi:hypothetical protein HK105_209132 [Polyrhizophydium stewartii]|uniref:ODAD1 central coiled coil region domain-containing protein n=1 Tax=Polyrhizophydium stewartii TaxID=2732419 RepID=A0ABR4MW13_9FUNG|nr:Coiled-coil domain-containing protein 63 [Polyrhizophydium stewartii]